LSTQILPSIRITPDKALADRRVDVRLGGFEAGQDVTVRAHMRDDLSRLWLSDAQFRADDMGEIDLSAQAPISGTYSGTDAMGLIWSMSLDPSEGELSRFLKRALTPIVITFTAAIDWEPVATSTLERLYIAPDVAHIKVRENPLAASFFHPVDGGPHPGVIVLGAADGGIYEGVAARFASHGFAALSLAYFGVEHLSPRLANIPLEYFKLALAWMEKHPQVRGERIALVGWSKGGEAALLIGAAYPQQVSAVVAYVPSSLMTVSSTKGVPDLADMQSSWSHKGRPLPFLPLPDDTEDAVQSTKDKGPKPSTIRPSPFVFRPIFEAALQDREAVEGATIPVERIDAPVLLISGQDDAMWPSSLMCKWVMERLVRHHRPHKRQHLSYPDAGHTIGIPYRPTTVTEHLTPSGALLQFGGTAAGNAHAEADSWPRVLDFLREA
jgi:dienelactone hydrolase